VTAEPERVVHRRGELDLAGLARRHVELHTLVDALQVQRRGMIPSRTDSIAAMLSTARPRPAGAPSPTSAR
jgi:hypothetical protein